MRQGARELETAQKSGRGTRLATTVFAALVAMALAFSGGSASAAEVEIGPALGACPSGTPDPYPGNGVRHDYCYRTSEHASISVEPADVTDESEVTLSLSLTTPECSSGVPADVYPCVRNIDWGSQLTEATNYRLIRESGTFFRTLDGTVVFGTSPMPGGYYHPLQPQNLTPTSCIYGSPRPSTAMTCTRRLEHVVGRGGLPHSWMVFMSEIDVALGRIPGTLSEDRVEYVIETVSRLRPADPPTASFTWQASATDPLTVDFDASASTDDEPIATYGWFFGDGEVELATGPTSSHTYDAEGTYTVTLVVTDNEKAADSVRQQVTIGSETPNTPPTASFSWGTSADDPLTKEFDASASFDNTGIDRYEWDFGDGESGTGVQPSHTFASAGTYPVKLTVFDAEGLADSVTQNVVVRSIVLTVGAETPQAQGVLRGQRIRYTLDAQTEVQASTLTVAGTVRPDLVEVDEASISGSGVLSADGATIDWAFANTTGTDPPLTFEVVVRTDAPPTTLFIPLDATARATLPSRTDAVSTTKLVPLLRERSITIVKETDPSTDPQDFSFAGSGSIGDFTLDTDPSSDVPDRRTFTGLDIGTYTVSESAADGWELDRLECTDSSGGTTTDLELAKATIDLAEDDAVTCTFHTKGIAALEATFASIDPEDFEIDEPVAVRVVVANTGAVPVDAVVPTLSLTGPSGPLETPEPQALPTLPPAAEFRLDYSFTPTEAGPYEISFSAAGSFQGRPVAAPPISSSHTASGFDRTVAVWHPFGTIPDDTATTDHVARIDDMLVDDMLQLRGADWDPDGGPIELRLPGHGEGFDMVRSLPAAAEFDTEVKVDFPVLRGANPSCVNTLTATQDGVTRTIEIHGFRGDLVAYAHNVERIGGTGGFAESNSVECRGWGADLTEPLATLVVQDLGGRSLFYERGVGHGLLSSPGVAGYDGLWLVSPDFGLDVYGVFGDVRLLDMPEDIFVRGMPVENVQHLLPGGTVPPSLEVYGSVQLRPTNVITLVARLITIAGNPPPELLETSAAAGTTRLDVPGRGVEPGDRVRVNPGGATQEDGTMGARGSIILADPLQFDHAAGESVIRLGPGSAGACTLEATTSAGAAMDATVRCPDDGERRYALVSAPAHGQVTVASDGGFRYVPTPGFAGDDVFTFRSVHAQSTETMEFGDSGPTTFRIHVTQPFHATLVAPTPAGSTRLEVSSNAGLVGKVVAIGEGSTAEVNYVVTSGPLRLARPLRFAHALGEPVVALDDTLFVSVDRALITRSSRLPDIGVVFGTLRPVAGRSIACGDDVSLTLDGGLVPGTRFVRQKGNRCVFVAKTESAIGRLELDLENGTWNAEIVRRDLERLTNPVELALAIGDDAGGETLVFRETRAVWTYVR